MRLVEGSLTDVTRKTASGAAELRNLDPTTNFVEPAFTPGVTGAFAAEKLLEEGALDV
jgi:hypothetical protein